MSVVIIGGHDRMVSQYKKICRNYKCKAKVFTQMSASLDKQIGSPDLLVLFTNTVSHKMIRCALDEGGKRHGDRPLPYQQRHSPHRNPGRKMRGLCRIGFPVSGPASPPASVSPPPRSLRCIWPCPIW